jgi:hypothetical protein
VRRATPRERHVADLHASDRTLLDDGRDAALLAFCVERTRVERRKVMRVCANVRAICESTRARRRFVSCLTERHAVAIISELEADVFGGGRHRH